MSCQLAPKRWARQQSRRALPGEDPRRSSTLILAFQARLPTWPLLSLGFFVLPFSNVAMEPLDSCARYAILPASVAASFLGLPFTASVTAYNERPGSESCPDRWPRQGIDHWRSVRPSVRYVLVERLHQIFVYREASCSLSRSHCLEERAIRQRQHKSSSTCNIALHIPSLHPVLSVAIPIPISSQQHTQSKRLCILPLF